LILLHNRPAMRSFLMGYGHNGLNPPQVSQFTNHSLRGLLTVVRRPKLRDNRESHQIMTIGQTQAFTMSHRCENKSFMQPMRRLSMHSRVESNFVCLGKWGAWKGSFWAYRGAHLFLYPVPNAQVCVYLTVHIPKLQVQTTFPKPLYIPHSTCIHQDPGRWKSWCLHCLCPMR
jgi:hypothetical protein